MKCNQIGRFRQPLESCNHTAKNSLHFITLGRWLGSFSVQYYSYFDRMLHGGLTEGWKSSTSSLALYEFSTSWQRSAHTNFKYNWVVKKTSDIIMYFDFNHQLAAQCRVVNIEYRYRHRYYRRYFCCIDIGIDNTLLSRYRKQYRRYFYGRFFPILRYRYFWKD